MVLFETSELFILNNTLMSNYFNTMEKTDYEKLEQFQSERDWFAEIFQTPKKHPYDASGYTKDGRLAVIELKTRNAVLTQNNTLSGHNFNDSTVFIEEEKIASLLLQYVINDAIPLYINFLQDGTTLIWNLSTLKTLPKHFCDVTIDNKGYKGVQKTYREGLYISDAKVYKPLITA